MHFRLSLYLLFGAVSAFAQAKPRARDLSIPLGGTAGPLDAITDVAGVEVGFTTLISGTGRLVVGTGPVRTGVTVIHPRGKNNSDPVFGAWFTLNGNGEMTGTTWLQEGGFLEGPVGITNTHSVGVVRDAIIAEGCHLERCTIDESIVGIRTTIQTGAAIRRSVLLGADFYEADDDAPARTDSPRLGIGRDVVLDRVIVDKNARIGDGARLTNDAGVERADGDGYYIRDGIIVVPKDGVIKPGTKV